MANEPLKLWNVRVEVHGGCDVEVVEKRGMDSGQKVQILINAFERESAENGEDKACVRRERSAC